MDKEKLIETLNKQKELLNSFHGPFDDLDSFIEELKDDSTSVTNIHIDQGIIKRPTIKPDIWDHYGTNGTTTWEIDLTNGSMDYNVIIGFYNPERDQTGVPVKE